MRVRSRYSWSFNTVVLESATAKRWHSRWDPLHSYHGSTDISFSQLKTVCISGATCFAQPIYNKEQLYGQHLRQYGGEYE